MAITITSEEKKLLKDIQLPVCPQILVNIANEAKKEDPNMHLISQWISEDIGIASAVLQIVNSPAFARNSKVDSIQNAVMLLGFNRVFPIVKTVALQSSVTSKHDLTSFWKISSQVAQTAINICHFIEKPELGDTAYMLGLFHMAGIPILLNNFDDYFEIYNQHPVSGWPNIIEQEQSKYGTTHTTLSAFIAHKWGLSAAQYESVYYLSDCDGIFESAELNQESLYLLSILKIARQCVFRRNNIECQTEWSNIVESLETFLEMDESDIEEIIDQAEQQFE